MLKRVSRIKRFAFHLSHYKSKQLNVEKFRLFLPSSEFLMRLRRPQPDNCAVIFSVKLQNRQ